MTKEEAWAAFAEQYNHRLHGPSDAFKFAWEAATNEEREACAAVAREWVKAYPHPSGIIANNIMARGEA